MISTLLRAPRFAPRVVPRLITRVNPVRFNSAIYRINKDSDIYKYQDGPKVVKFTAEHEWLAVHSDDSAHVGITNYASEALGDATFIELPEVGTVVEAGESIGSVESVKSASEIYAPVSGEVIAVNEVLESTPGLINDDPMGQGWIAHIKLSEPLTIETNEELLDSAAYESSLEEH